MGGVFPEKQPLSAAFPERWPPAPPGAALGGDLAGLLGAAEDEHAVPAHHRLARQQGGVVRVLWAGAEGGFASKHDH